jgi:hypothetical protein
LTVIVKVCGVPVHGPSTGVTVIVAVIGSAVALVAVNDAMLPLPDAASPIAVFEFVQLNVDPAVPVKFTAVVAVPAHKVWFAGSVTVGVGFTVIVKVCGVPVHGPKTGVTVIVDVIGSAVALVAVKDAMFPLPDAASPIAVFELVQLNVDPAVPVKFTAVVAVPAHKV